MEQFSWQVLGVLTFEEGVGAGWAKLHFVAFAGNPPGESEGAATVWEGAAHATPSAAGPSPPPPAAPPHRISETRGPKSVERPSNRQDENALWVQLSPGGTE